VALAPVFEAHRAADETADLFGVDQPNVVDRGVHHVHSGLGRQLHRVGAEEVILVVDSEAAEQCVHRRAERQRGQDEEGGGDAESPHHACAERPLNGQRDADSEGDQQDRLVAGAGNLAFVADE
jgi:hypothetical protein